LERIENSAFKGIGLKSIVIPSSVIVLSEWSFGLCESLESVTFESGSQLERIEELAFQSSGLKSIEIPSSISFVAGSAFCGVYLNCVSMSEGAGRFRIDESFLENACGSTIYRYFGYCHSIVIPSSVIVLSKSSFAHCRSLESVTFESGSQLERIEKSAFSMSGLKSIVIPSSVIVLSESSFASCWFLESVTFESGSQLERIEKSAFSGSELKSIVIPPSNPFLADSAFLFTRLTFPVN
jgi:hypothetical protein